MATAAGLTLSNQIAIPDYPLLEFIFPMSFVALTMPLLRHRRDVVTGEILAYRPRRLWRCLAIGLAMHGVFRTAFP